MDLLERLDLRYPIFQAPMAGVATPELAAAVTNAGGLGALGLGAASAETARAMIAATRTKSPGPLHINVFCHRAPVRDPAREKAWIEHFREDFARLSVAAPETLDTIYASFLDSEDTQAVLRETRPDVVSFHFGVPAAALLSELRGLGILTLVSVTNAAEAASALERGIDGLIAQGYEAGGHRGFFDPSKVDNRLSTRELVQLLVAQFSAPVIAAGGAMSGSDIRDLLALGASAVQLGTAFLLCPEAATDSGYRESIRAATGDDTLMTAALSGRAARGIGNALVSRGTSDSAPAVPDYPLTYDLSKRLIAAARAREIAGYGAYWAGRGVGRAREMPAAELVAVLAEEAGLSGSK